MEPLPGITISAAVTTYNRAKELLECIQSMQRQTVPVEEIIVIDDGSTDDTAKIISNAKKNEYYTDNLYKTAKQRCIKCQKQGNS